MMPKGHVINRFYNKASGSYVDPGIDVELDCQEQFDRLVKAKVIEPQAETRAPRAKKTKRLDSE